VAEVSSQLENAGLPARVMIDCSHANSNKDYRRQVNVCHEVAEQVRAGNRHIIGVMLESNLVAGAQKLTTDQPLVYGQSITDACLGWTDTLPLLRELAKAVRERRSQK
jgi:3-deoxy-7-phosphoheptulonate synthase